jgi:hypothetical protein
MRPRLRKLTLTVHLLGSVGWFGAVAGTFALATAALGGHDVETARAADTAVHVVGWYVLVPCAVTSLLSGLVLALGSAWGLFRYYWVPAKLVINLASLVALLAYLPSLDQLPDLNASVHEMQDRSGVAALLLLAAAVLGVYKPFGLTPYGRRRRQRAASAARSDSATNVRAPQVVGHPDA